MTVMITTTFNSAVQFVIFPTLSPFTLLQSAARWQSTASRRRKVENMSASVSNRILDIK